MNFGRILTHTKRVSQGYITNMYCSEELLKKIKNQDIAQYHNVIGFRFEFDLIFFFLRS